MNIADLARPSRRYRVGYRALVVTCVLALSCAFYTERKNAALTYVVEELVRTSDVQRDSIAMARVMAIVRSMDIGLAEALRTGGAVAADSFLRRASRAKK